MSLDTTIEQRKRELTNITGDINNERDYNEGYRNDLKRSQLELLARRLEKSQATFTNVKLQQMSKKFDEVATNRYQAVPEEMTFQVSQALDQEMRKNSAIDAIVNRLRSEDPMLD